MCVIRLLPTFRGVVLPSFGLVSHLCLPLCLPSGWFPIFAFRFAFLRVGCFTILRVTFFICSCFFRVCDSLTSHLSWCCFTTLRVGASDNSLCQVACNPHYWGRLPSFGLVSLLSLCQPSGWQFFSIFCFEVETYVVHCNNSPSRVTSRHECHVQKNKKVRNKKRQKNEESRKKKEESKSPGIEMTKIRSYTSAGLKLSTEDRFSTVLTLGLLPKLWYAT